MVSLLRGYLQGEFLGYAANLLRGMCDQFAEKI
jgi:hypothetical protein